MKIGAIVDKIYPLPPSKPEITSAKREQDMGLSRPEDHELSHRLKTIKSKIDNNYYNSPQAKIQIAEKLSEQQIFLLADCPCDKFEGYF